MKDASIYGATLEGTQPEEPEFQPGDVVIIDPEKRIRPGDYIAVRASGSGEIEVHRRGQAELEGKILGKVIQRSRKV